MAIIRGHHSFDDKFTQIPNAWLRDSRLSFKAIGLLAQIMSHNSGWKLTIALLAEANNTGKETIRSAVAELEKFGYLKREQPRAGGRFQESIWTTQDPDSPTPSEPMSENSTTDNPTLKKTIETEEQSKEEQVRKNPTLISSDFKPRTLDANRVTYPQTDIDLALADFISYWTEKRTRRADWDATWRNNISKIADWPRYQKKQNSIWESIEETK